MLAVGMDYYVAIYVEIIYCFFSIVSFIYEFIRRRQFYNEVIRLFNQVEEKSYIIEMIDRPDFTDGKILYELLRKESKYLNDCNQKHNEQYLEYRHYIETWVHEVKTPIATSKLLIENNKNIVTLSIEEEITKIDDYIEQVLYVSKSDTAEKDYHINRIYMKTLIMDVVKRKSKEMINEGIRPSLHELEYYVLTDEKWMSFIIGQIVSNAIKYKNESPMIEFYCEEEGNKVHLYIKDNGIGIPEQDITRVFEKGFTGINGRRKHSSSTGIGLYLCKRLCDKLEIGIEIASELSIGTTIRLTFLKDRR